MGNLKKDKKSLRKRAKQKQLPESIVNEPESSVKSSKLNKIKSSNNGSNNTQKDRQPTGSVKLAVQNIFVVILAIACGSLNSYHQSTMFENDRHFSHLSSLEREMTFRSEMGLYYSYFKIIIEAPSSWHGIHQIMNDNRTEYPSVINTLQRFNLYPEVFLGISYRIFQHTADYFNIKTKECWEVIRGDELPPVQSCEGLGDPAYFYTRCVFLLNGLVGSLMFLYGRILSNSIFGGVLAASCFFFNHGQSTRVQWTPPLRESFGYPVFLLEMLIVTITLKNTRPKGIHSMVIAVLVTIFMLFWQFAQFALVTQTLAIFVTYLLNIIPANVLKCILRGHMAGLFLAFILLFGNKMLLTSFYAPVLVTCYVATFLEKHIKNLKNVVLQWICYFTFLVLGSSGLKAFASFILMATDDVHIWNILRSKMTSYRDLHTMLYTCAAEYDFLQLEAYRELTKTLLLPAGLVISIAISAQLFWKWRKMKTIELYEDGNVLYNLLQAIAFFVMAVLIMRLKLFFTPHLCLITSLIMMKKWLIIFKKPEVQYTVVTILLGLMAFQGIQNINHQRNILGEYSNPELEELILWVNSSTDQNSVFAGPMPTMANLMLSTRRPIVNHPHYEDAELRERTYKVYQIYSRKSSDVVHQALLGMGVNFVVIEKQWCFGKSKQGCFMADIWDVEDTENQGKKPLCQKLIMNAMPFQNVFQNSVYTVLAVGRT